MQIDFPFDSLVFESRDELRQELLGRLASNTRKNFALVSGKTASRGYAESLLGSGDYRPAICIEVSDGSVDDVYAAEREIRGHSPSLIIAVGGGKVADFAKRLAYLANIPLFLVPTILANDGLISPIAVLQDHGVSVSLPGRMADVVFIDLSILNSAPKRYIRAAACDLITNLSATNDWVRVTLGETARVHHLALQLARMAAYRVLDCSNWDLSSQAFLRTILDGQILSGISMALSGSSRPCSGSEHLISHALDSMKIGMDTLHGEKVGVTSRFCLHLQGVKSEQLDLFFKEFEVACVFPGCADMKKTEITEIFARARLVRPGRATILDSFSDFDLADRYFKYIADKEDTK